MADDEVQPGWRRWGWARGAFDPGTSLVFARHCPFVGAGRSGNWAFAVDQFYRALHSAIPGHDVIATLSTRSEAMEGLWTPKPNESVEYYAAGKQTLNFEPYQACDRGPKISSTARC